MVGQRPLKSSIYVRVVVPEFIFNNLEMILCFLNLSIENANKFCLNKKFYQNI